MTDPDRSRISPLEPPGAEPDRPSPWVAAAVVAALVGGLIGGVLLLDTGDNSRVGPSTTTAPDGGAVEPAGTTTTEALTTTTSPAPPPAGEGDRSLREVLPDVDGTLYALVGNFAPELLTWPADGPPRSTELPLPPQPVFDLDASSRYPAFLGPSATTDGSTLYLSVDGDEWAPARVRVTSFAWHRTLPGRIAWTEREHLPRLCTGMVGDDGLGDPSCVPGIPGRLVGFDDAGFLVDGQGAIVRLDDRGSVVGSVSGIHAEIGPDGRVLIFEIAPDGSLDVSLTGPELNGPVGLLTGLPATGGTPVAWSPPTVHPVQLAYLVRVDDGRWELRRRALGESPAEIVGEVVELEGRVFDVSWDDTGRYLLVAGVIDERFNVIYVYDTGASELVQLLMGDWVLDMHLVVPAGCEDAGAVTAELARRLLRLPEGVSLEDARMVRSRDMGLIRWYFVAARVVGGSSDGEIASWAFPGFDGDVPNLVVPIEETAASLGFGMGTLDPADYGVDDWFELDGAELSRWCVEQAAVSR